VLNGFPFTVVGVAPRGFQGTTLLRADLWLPLSMLVEAAPRMNANMLTEHRIVWLVMGGRLKPGVSVRQAQSEMDAIAAAIEREFPNDYKGRGVAVAQSALVPGRTNIVAGFVGMLMAIVGLLLLIACVNVAGMMLARAAARRREIAVRIAIGAGRWRLIRQLLTEALIIFSAAGLIGLVLSHWLTSLLLALLPQLPVPIAVDVPTDWRVLTFSIVLSMLAALLSGLAPALQASGFALLPALKTEGLDGGSSKLRLRNAFVIGQVTMSLLLVVTAGLFLRALQHATSIQPGFDQDRVDVVFLDLAVGGLKEDSGRLFVRRVLERLERAPGVASASMTVDLPLDGGRMGLGDLAVAGVPTTDPRHNISADWNVVEPGFFKTLGIRLVAGRDFTTADTKQAPGVAIVNAALARRAWPDRDPIGQRLVRGDMNGDRQELTVVGVTTDAQLITLGGTVEPFIYVPMAQQYMTRVAFVTKNAGDASAVPQVRAIIRELNPNLPVSEAMPLRDVTAIGLVPQRIAASVAGSLGLVGLILASIGIYGVTAYSVSRRTKEIGIRVALGADTSRVLRLVLRQGVTLAAIGVTIGIIFAAIASQFLASLLYGIPPLDPLTFAGACVLFALVTIGASYVPARRAALVDPVTALRTE
jgi:predicted permease